MKYNILSDLCDYNKEKIDLTLLNKDTYISTENMLPNKSGVIEASTLPNIKQTQSFKKGDTLVSNIRPYFKKVWFAEFDGGCSNDVLVLKAKEGVNKRFLFYVVSNDQFFDYSMATSKGTKMPRGDKNAIMKYKVPNFTSGEQEKIIGILKSLDDKIELNNKINNNLEQQAQALFKSWFIDFEPFDGVIPSEWRIGLIQDLAREIICGKTPSTKVAEYYGFDVPFITIPDMHDKVYVVTTERYLSKLGEHSQAKKTLPKNSICVSCIGTAGLVTLVSEESQTNQQINSIIPKDGFSPYYIYLLMQVLSDTINQFGQSGSTIVNLNKTQFGKIKAVIPSVDVMARFDHDVSPLFEKIHKNQKENITLASLRNTLLPKLMSGELDVSSLAL